MFGVYLIIAGFISINANNICNYPEKYNETLNVTEYNIITEKYTPKECTGVSKIFYWVLGKCKTKYRSITKTEVKNVTEIKYRNKPICCDGWTDLTQNCTKPYCNPPCMYGQCIRPYQCSCDPGWTGNVCGDKCPGGTYGHLCASKCNCHSANHNNLSAYSVCHHVTGECQCGPGFKGIGCQEKCIPGTYGFGCSEQCECQYKSQCRSTDGFCDCSILSLQIHHQAHHNPVQAELVNFEISSFTINASKRGQIHDNHPQLHNKRISKSDNKSTFATHYDVVPFHTGRFCNLPCVLDFNCTQSCECEDANGECNPYTGQCLCKPGFIGPRCEMICPPDTFGPDCKGRCMCQNGAFCDPINGSCSCKAGWSGENCQYQCQKGRYGLACAKTCDCIHFNSCDAVNGTCGCQSGWTGARCNVSCDQGLYGPNCNSTCSCGHDFFQNSSSAFTRALQSIASRTELSTSYFEDKFSNIMVALNKNKAIKTSNTKFSGYNLNTSWDIEELRAITNLLLVKTIALNKKAPKDMTTTTISTIKFYDDYVIDYNKSLELAMKSFTTSNPVDFLQDKIEMEYLLNYGINQTNMANFIAGMNDTMIINLLSALLITKNGTLNTYARELFLPTCSAVDGTCTCPYGRTGKNCGQSCLPGFWGPNCANVCQCEHAALQYDGNYLTISEQGKNQQNYVKPHQSCNQITGKCGPCQAGWHGERCHIACGKGFYGPDCANRCDCIGAETCHPLTGTCICPAGKTGHNCSEDCPDGWFGIFCQHMCTCAKSKSITHKIVKSKSQTHDLWTERLDRMCDPVSGICNCPNVQMSRRSRCTRCLHGFWGLECDKPCPSNCSTISIETHKDNTSQTIKLCDRKTGQCLCSSQSIHHGNTDECLRNLSKAFYDKDLSLGHMDYETYRRQMAYQLDNASLLESLTLYQENGNLTNDQSNIAFNQLSSSKNATLFGLNVVYILILIVCSAGLLFCSLGIGFGILYRRRRRRKSIQKHSSDLMRIKEIRRDDMHPIPPLPAIPTNFSFASHLPLDPLNITNAANDSSFVSLSKHHFQDMTENIYSLDAYTEQENADLEYAYPTSCVGTIDRKGPSNSFSIPNGHANVISNSPGQGNFSTKNVLSKKLIPASSPGYQELRTNTPSSCESNNGSPFNLIQPELTKDVTSERSSSSTYLIPNDSEGIKMNNIGTVCSKSSLYDSTDGKNKKFVVLRSHPGYCKLDHTGQTFKNFSFGKLSPKTLKQYTDHNLAVIKRAEDKKLDDDGNEPTSIEENSIGLDGIETKSNKLAQQPVTNSNGKIKKLKLNTVVRLLTSHSESSTPDTQHIVSPKITASSEPRSNLRQQQPFYPSENGDIQLRNKSKSGNFEQALHITPTSSKISSGVSSSIYQSSSHQSSAMSPKTSPVTPFPTNGKSALRNSVISNDGTVYHLPCARKSVIGPVIPENAKNYDCVSSSHKLTPASSKAQLDFPLAIQVSNDIKTANGCKEKPPLPQKPRKLTEHSLDISVDLYDKPAITSSRRASENEVSNNNFRSSNLSLYTNKDLFEQYDSPPIQMEFKGF